MGVKGSMMTLESWREESKRLLSRIAKDQPYGKQATAKQQGKSKQDNGFKLIALYLGESDLCKTDSVYRKAYCDNPNMTRFKLLQTQKKHKN